MSREEHMSQRDVSNAGIAISDRINRDVSSSIDLEESLEASRYASHPYTTHPKEWPPLVEVGDKWELPSVLIERYNSADGESTALCGIFPEIQRAWASVDDSLFLWRFDKWDGQCAEYSGEEQAICAVGLVKSKPGVFVEAIQYLLILATPAELALIGVCCCGSPDGTDPYAEVALQSLPEYAVPSDGVTMTCITCTDKGRIFLAGRDGHIYELLYTTGSGWYRRCRKVCLTAGFSSVISRWVVPDVFKFGAVDSIVDIVVDNERHTLYTRTEGMKIQVFEMGENGHGSLRKVAEGRNLINQRDASHGGRQSSANRAPKPSVKSSIVCISPLSSLESKCLHLVAVLSDGRRLYCSTGPSNGSNGTIAALGGFNTNSYKPSCLKVVATRPSPPLGVSGGLSFGSGSLAARSQTEDLSLKIETAYYSGGTLILFDSSPPTTSSLLIVGKDSTAQPPLPGSFGISSRISRALRESVSSLPIEGRMLNVVDISLLPGTSVAQSLYSELELCGIVNSGEDCEKAVGKLRAKGDLSTQHILPRRRIVVFSTMGMMELVFNRPVDILRRLLESNSPRSALEDFFNRFGAGEAAAMCLMLAARLIDAESFISNVLAEKAIEVFEEPGLVGVPQLKGGSASPNNNTFSGGFSMGQVVQEAEPMFSGVYEGLCLCSARLLLPVWELPVMGTRGGSDSSCSTSTDGVVVCRLSVSAMHILENKIRSLEKLVRSRKNQRKGLYGYVTGLGDANGSILYRGADVGAGDRSMMRNLFGFAYLGSDATNGSPSNKRRRLSYSPEKLAAIEVREMECIRQLLLRSGELLFLLQLLCQHHVTRLIQGLDPSLQQDLLQMTFHQLVCSEEGDRMATRLISGLMEHYTGPDGGETVNDISRRLREGCPSYYKESDQTFYSAVEYLDRAAVSSNSEERDSLARKAFNLLSSVPDSADLHSVCKRFEDLRFYDAVVHLPLQKAQALDPAGDAVNEQMHLGFREHAISLREQLYEIVTTALSNLKGGSSRLSTGVTPIMDPAARKKHICQIVQLAVQWPDRLFHEYLYYSMMNLGLEDELLRYGGTDLVSFLQSAACEPTEEVVPTRMALVSSFSRSSLQTPSKQAKYLDLLARYYVMKRQNLHAAHVLLKLAESRPLEGRDFPSLEQRCQYLSNAVLQAKNARDNDDGVSSARDIGDDGLLDLLEGKLAVVRFQIKIKEELENIALKFETPASTSDSVQNKGISGGWEANQAASCEEKVEELSSDLKSITELYNEYAVPFELWEICLELLYFANYSGDTDNCTMRETWARLIDQAVSKGGVVEACSVLKRIGSRIYPGDGLVLPLEILCLHLEKATLERLNSGQEYIGEEDVPRSLLSVCRGSAEPVLNTYEQLLSTGTVLTSPVLRVRLIRSVLVVLREWALSVYAQRTGTGAVGASLMLTGSGTFSMDVEQAAFDNPGFGDRITSAVNRYMNEVKRLPLPESEKNALYRGFCDIEKSISRPSCGKHT